MARITRQQAMNLLNGHKPKAKSKTPKYRNTKITVDGITYDSQKEYQRFTVLSLHQRAGLISDLKHHVSYELMPAVKFAAEKRQKRSMCYIADYTYTDLKTGLFVVEDVKSAMTRKLPAYRQKKHLMMTIHGIEIKEV